VADQFWELAQRSKGLNLDWASEFLLLAAELLLLKARLLLEAPSFREEEDLPLGLCLEERLKVYQVYRRAAEGLRERLAQGALIFSRPPETGICRDREEMPRQIAPEKLLEFYLKALSRKKQSSEIKTPYGAPSPHLPGEQNQDYFQDLAS